MRLAEAITDNRHKPGRKRHIAHLVGDLPVILMEISPSNGAIVKSYIHANGRILAQHDGDHTAESYFYLHDRLGSVRQIINSYGYVQKYYTYEPFGETIESGGSFDDSFRFTGQYLDAEIGEYYLRARQYNPHVARFTSRDPVFGDFQHPLTLHKYLYCGNDPVNLLDPVGLDAYYFTLTTMLSGMASKIYQEGWVIDDYGNVGRMSLESYEGYGSPYIFGGGSFGWSPNADTIYDLGGDFFSVGASIGVGGFGAEYFSSLSNDVHGFEVSFGGSPPGLPEAHFHWTRTRIERVDMNWREFLGKMEESLEEQWDNMNRVIDLYIWGAADAMLRQATDGLSGLEDFEEPGGRRR